jgi:uncharacterized protein involved in exopolysaccharide biosynthesis
MAVLLGWLRRFWYVAAVLAVLGAAAGLAAGTLIKPRFTSYSDVLVDPSNLQVLADDIYTNSAQGDAQLLDVESKMRVLSSTNVLARVVRTLNLEANADLLEPEFPILANLSPSDSGKQDSFTAAVRALGERVRVRREERSYVVTASVWARTPEQSVVLTDALVQAFMAELAQGESDGALSTSTALTERLGQLQADAAAAEAAVADYRRKHGLPVVNANAEQLSTQSAVQINTQVAAAREALIAAEALYTNLTAGSGEGRANAAAQASAVLGGLRAQYAAARQRADSLAATLGRLHPTLVAARSEVASLQAEIDREIARVVQTAMTSLDQARSVLAQLTEAQSAQMGEVFTDDDAQVELRQLERAAASKVALYDAYLTRAEEITQRSQINTTNVRVISPAIAPLSRNYPPRTVLLVAGGLFAGLTVGLGLAALLGYVGQALARRKTA